MVTHRSLSNYVVWALRTYTVQGAHGSLLHTSISFDLTVTSLWVPLLSGQRVVLFPESIEPLGATLLSERNLSFVKMTPSHLRVLGQQVLPHELACWSHSLVLGGEALLGDDLALWREHAPATVICNEYGPTETVVGCSLYTAFAGDLATGSVPIGRPSAGARFYLLDRDLRLVPVGVPGELYIGGEGVARGYLDRPELTAEKFVPDLFGGVPGGRLYRTGDLVRWLSDGNVEFLGRLDQQVKVRGFRIELGEVEAALARHSDIQAAAVVVHERDDGYQRLAAYVVPSGERLEIEELRRALARCLPQYMIPVSFTAIAELPLTPSGKLDRKALPVPEQGRPSEEHEAPHTASEELLAGIWAEVLRVQHVGVHDNFFALGGDSILSIQLVARAARVGLRITPKQVFEHPTIAKLALVAGAAPEVETEQGWVTGPVPLTPIQSWFFEAQPTNPPYFNQAVLLRVQQPLAPAVVNRAWEALLRHHDALRLRFESDGQFWKAWNEAPSADSVPWRRIDLSALSAAGSRGALEKAAEQVQGSLELSAAPLVRSVWFDLAGDVPRLLLVIHHLVIDGVSWRVLLEDLEVACRQLAGGEVVRLPAKTTSFQTWARRLVEHARTLDPEPELSWWRRECAESPTGLTVDHPGGANVVASQHQVSVWLSAEETRLLLQEVPAAYRTQINDVLLTALVQALGGPAQVLRVDLEGHGREEILPGVDLSRTVGWFTTLFPVRLEVGAEPDPGAVLKAIKEHLRALPNRGIGYGLLRYLHPEEPIREQLASARPAQVSFNYLGQFDQVLSDLALFSPAAEASGAVCSPEAQRRYVLDVLGLIAGGRLRVDWLYSENLHRRTTVEQMAAEFLERLRELIAHCLSPEAGGYTPSDFPLAGLGQGELDRLLGSERQIEEVYRLSPLQEGILFETLYTPDSGVYIEQLSCRFRGDLDMAALQGACRKVVDHHPVLRTSFHWQELDRPFQVVHGSVDVELEYEDWSGVSPAEQEQRLRHLLRTDRQRGFDLSRAPLMRWKLIRTGASEHWFLWTHHHILLDGWSAAALTAEFLACYEALREGVEPRLQRRLPYRDYIAWLQRQDLVRAEQFWRRALAGWTEPTILALDRREKLCRPRSQASAAGGSAGGQSAGAGAAVAAHAQHAGAGGLGCPAGALQRAGRGGLWCNDVRTFGRAARDRVDVGAVDQYAAGAPGRWRTVPAPALVARVAAPTGRASSVRVHAARPGPGMERGGAGRFLVRDHPGV